MFSDSAMPLLPLSEKGHYLAKVRVKIEPLKNAQTYLHTAINTYQHCPRATAAESPELLNV